MSAQILTEVSATVDANREAELVTGFREITTEGIPDGLVRTELLRGEEGRWRIQTLWRDRAALDGMRARTEPLAASRLFRSVGAEPSLQVYEVQDRHMSAE